jgi:LysM repeat protein
VTASDPLVVEVSPDDALVLAHLVLGGTQLSYAVWPGGVEPAETPPLDERTVRALLGLQPPSTPTPEPTLAPPASATPVPPAPSPTPLPPPATSTPVPVPVAPGPVADRYVVQPGDSLFGVADQLGIDRARMQTANPNVPPDGPLPPGMQLVVPQEG